jgi:hypothetical protein
VRTTIRIDDALYRSVKAKAATTGRTVGEVIEDALRSDLRPRARAASDATPLPTFGGSGVMPGVDLTSNTDLRALMDEGSDVDALR